MNLLKENSDITLVVVGYTFDIKFETQMTNLCKTSKDGSYIKVKDSQKLKTFEKIFTGN